MDLKVQIPIELSDTSNSVSTITHVPIATTNQKEIHNGPSDIVIGMAQDTDPKNLVTFCASLRK